MTDMGESMNFISLFTKGIVIGLFMLVPGISGGSIAILLNIYEDLLVKLNNLFKDFKNNFKFLLVVLLGGIIGIFISVFFLEIVFEMFYFEMIFAFIGMMIYHFLTIIYKSGKKKIIKNVLLMVIGVGIGLGLTMLPINIFNIQNKYLNLFIVGVFLAAALILPGISVSYVLLIFKMYDTLLFAIKTFDLLYLLEMMIALIIGTLLVIKGLNYLIIKKNDILESVIIGFVFASVWVVLPIIKSCKDLIYGMIFIILGVIIRTLFHNR